MFSLFDLMGHPHNKPKNERKAAIVKNSGAIQNQAESSGVRFASRDSVKLASSWMIARYAVTFKKLAQ